MFERLKYLYRSEKLTIEQLEIAVLKGWITNEQKSEMVVLG